MSHRDKDGLTGSETFAQELSGVVDGLLSGVDWKDVAFREDCRWAPRGLVMAALIWAWSSRSTLGGRFERGLRITRKLGRQLAPKKASYQAFMKLLVRWTGKLRECLVLAFQRLMQTRLGDSFEYAGYVLLGCTF